MNGIGCANSRISGSYLDGFIKHHTFDWNELSNLCYKELLNLGNKFRVPIAHRKNERFHSP